MLWAIIISSAIIATVAHWVENAGGFRPWAIDRFADWTRTRDAARNFFEFWMTIMWDVNGRSLRPIRVSWNGSDIAHVTVIKQSSEGTNLVSGLRRRALAAFYQAKRPVYDWDELLDLQQRAVGQLGFRAVPVPILGAIVAELPPNPVHGRMTTYHKFIAFSLAKTDIRLAVIAEAKSNFVDGPNSNREAESPQEIVVCRVKFGDVGLDRILSAALLQEPKGDVEVLPEDFLEPRGHFTIDPANG